MRRADVIHLGLLLGALAAAYALPFELVLLSYAILGPAHYFTEISWLHDRGYFLPRRTLAVIPAAVAFAAMFIATPYWLGVTLWSVFVACAIAATTSQPGRTALYGVIALTATVVMIAAEVPFALAGVLLPTFIHVCVFTLVFMTLGALRSGGGVQFAILGAYLVALVLILIVPPWAGSVLPGLTRIAQENFGAVAPALGALIGVPDLTFGGRITGLLSFVYTYHYLNWFIKADVIRWSAVPRPRLIAIAALSAASTALYFYDFDVGILVLLVISLLHVLLEFPLNAISIGQLGAFAFRRRAATA